MFSINTSILKTNKVELFSISMTVLGLSMGVGVAVGLLVLNHPKIKSPILNLRSALSLSALSMGFLSMGVIGLVIGIKLRNEDDRGRYLQKAVAHAFNLKGSVQLFRKGEAILKSEEEESLEGGDYTRWALEMAAALDTSQAPLAQALRDTQQLRTSGELVEKQKCGRPILFSTGFPGHCVIVLVVGNRFLLCNRGGEMRKGVEAYRFDPSKLTPELIERMGQCKSREEYRKTLFEEIPKQLEFSQDDELKALEARCPLPRQRVGNCSWTSLEAAVWGYFHLTLPSDKAEVGFETFSNKVRSSLFGQLISLWITGPFQPNCALATAATAEMAKGILIN